MFMYTRKEYSLLIKRFKAENNLIQIIIGPRQTGKTTLALQVAEQFKDNYHYCTSDLPNPYSTNWIEQQWETARVLSKKSSKGTLLIMDEIQKIHNWSEAVKKLWDEDKRKKINLKVLLLGSSALLLQKGLTESLAGRFELIKTNHWSFAEMKECFNFDLDKYIYFGGYPSAVNLINDETRWSNYIKDSLIETTISRDIFLVTRIDKQQLFRQLFKLGTHYSSQIVSYSKLLGQLIDAGNTTTLAHYLRLLESSGIIAGLQKYSASEIKKKSSSPKFLSLNNALITSQSNFTFNEAKANKDFWGRLVENAIGAHLYSATLSSNLRLMYWREGSHEVDFILQNGKKIFALEVKSGRQRESIKGFDIFSQKYKPNKKLLVGGDGIPIEDFLLTPSEEWYI